jgi:hypothetical protein
MKMDRPFAFAASDRWVIAILILTLVACSRSAEPVASQEPSPEAATGGAGGSGPVSDGAQGPVEVLPGGLEVLYWRDRPEKIAVDGTSVYWTEMPAIARAPKGGGPGAGRLGPLGINLTSRLIVDDPGYIFWLYTDLTAGKSYVQQVSKANESTESILVDAIDPSAPRPSLVDDFHFGSLAVEPEAIYAASGRCNTIVAVSRTTGEQQRWPVHREPFDGGQTLLRAAGGTVYCAGSESLYAVTGGDVRVLARLDDSDRKIGDFVLHDRYVYFFVLNRGLGVQDRFYDLARVSTDSARWDDVAHFEGGSGPAEVAFDPPGTFYWPASKGQNVSVMSYDLERSETVVVASERALQGGIAVDDTYVYWTEWEALMRKRR